MARLKVETIALLTASGVVEVPMPPEGDAGLHGTADGWWEPHAPCVPQRTVQVIHEALAKAKAKAAA